MKRRIFNPFWGESMNRVLSILTERQIPWRPLSPVAFANMMDELTGLKHEPSASPEACAKLWLSVLA
jgi:hypothetical protein